MTSNRTLALFFLLASTALAQIQPRIVGGSNVKDRWAFPYFALLVDINCGAAVIHDDYLLTAAHCEPKNHPFNKQVYMGSLRHGQGLSRTIQYFQAHPAYIAESPNEHPRQDFDFALIKLSTSALVDEETGEPTGVQIVELNRNMSLPQPGDALQAMGFGATAEGSRQGMSERLKQVQVEYMPNDVCEEQYGVLQFNEHIMFCSGVDGGGKDTCQGDSGGPIVDVNTGSLAGVVSYGTGCARSNYFGVNARVSAVVDWIEEEICKGSHYPPDYCAERDDSLLATNITESLLYQEPVGAMTLIGTLDNYPKEFAWSLTYLGTNQTIDQAATELYLILPGTFQKLEAIVNKTFDGLLPGLYDVTFGDSGLDGVCCKWGEGHLKLVNDITSETIWEGGEYEGYLRLRIEIDQDGKIQILDRDDVYLPSWAMSSTTSFIPQYDPDWPGPMPEEPLFSFNINFKFDAYPSESGYRIYHLANQNLPIESWEDVAGINARRWKGIYTMRGPDVGEVLELVPYQLVNQQSGWYWLQVVDAAGDGICCISGGRGWVSLTGPIVTDMEFGVVWANDGRYSGGVDVYFYMNEDGYIAHVHWVVDGATATERSISVESQSIAGSGKHLRA